MSEQVFTGFTPQTFAFFQGLSENNNKPWFEEHKSEYQTHLLQPLKSLAVALTPAMSEIDPLMDFRPQKMISRIYRDIRFSHDKTPYKQHMWISFQRPFDKMSEAWESFPGYYMEIGAEGVACGMGLWMAKKKIMDRFREQVAYAPDEFEQMTRPLLQKHKYELGGDLYKRPIPNELPEYFQQWIQRRGLYLHKSIPVNDRMYTPEFVTLMEEEFRALEPFYNYFVDLCE